MNDEIHAKQNIDYRGRDVTGMSHDYTTLEKKLMFF